MRVLHVIPSLDSRDGGPTIAVTHMAGCVISRGIEVSIATTIDPDEASEKKIPLAEPFRMDSWTCYFFPRQSRFYKVSLGLHQWLQRHVADYDLVHIHAVFSFAPIAACRAARRARIPYVVCPHGLLNEWGMNQRKHLKALSFQLIERPLLNAASAIHYTSLAEQREAGPLCLTASPVIIPLGIETSAFRDLPDRHVFEERYPQARDRALVLFLSRIDPKKGLEVLLQAWKEIAESHPDALLVIAGSGASDYTASLQAMARDLGVTERLLWTGFLGHAEKCTALSAADVYVLPSKSESFGVALLEAMASGVSCVSTSGVALSEEAAAAGAIRIADAQDPASIAQAIGELLDSPDLRSRLGEAGRAFANSRYSLEAMGGNLASMYRKLVDPKETSLCIP